MSAYTKKPMIAFFVKGARAARIAAQIGFGMEEEGIPFERLGTEQDIDLLSLAHEAAGQSQLLVGIACDGQEAVLHHRHLPREQFVYRIRNCEGVSDSDLRLFGCNAARLVKGVAFKQSTVLEMSF